MRNKNIIIFLTILTLIMISACSITPEGGKFAELNALLDSGDLIEVSDVSYGPESDQYFDLYYPADLTEETPVVFVVHGGSGDADAQGVKARVPIYTELGYIVVNVNHARPAVPKAGTPFDIACSIAVFQSEAEKLGVLPDLDNVFLHGYSFGGRLNSEIAYSEDPSVWLEGCGVQDQDIKIKGFIGESSFYGVIIPEEYESEVEYNTLEEQRFRIEGPEELIVELEEKYSVRSDGSSVRNAAAFTLIGPLNSAESGPPALLLIGSKDEAATDLYSIEFGERLTELGINNHVYIMPGVQHITLLHTRTVARNKIQTFVTALVNDQEWPF